MLLSLTDIVVILMTSKTRSIHEIFSSEIDRLYVTNSMETIGFPIGQKTGAWSLKRYTSTDVTKYY